MITQQLLKTLFVYEDGNLLWKKPLSNVCKVGSIAGFVRPPQNYRYIGIEKKYYSAHRLIFMYHHGYLPDNVDHKDGNVLNNKIENLRPCTHSQNLFNSKKPSSNKSGYKGVSWYESNKKWCAKVKVGEKAHRKFFDDIEMANEWAMKTRNELHGEFVKHL